MYTAHVHRPKERWLSTREKTSDSLGKSLGSRQSEPECAQAHFALPCCLVVNSIYLNQRTSGCEPISKLIDCIPEVYSSTPQKRLDGLSPYSPSLVNVHPRRTTLLQPVNGPCQLLSQTFVLDALNRIHVRVEGEDECLALRESVEGLTFAA